MGREARADLELQGRCGHEDVSHLEDVQRCESENHRVGVGFLEGRDFYRFTPIHMGGRLLPFYAKIRSLLPYPHPMVRTDHTANCNSEQESNSRRLPTPGACGGRGLPERVAKLTVGVRRLFTDRRARTRRKFDHSYD